MRYELRFKEEALEKWCKLDGSIRDMLKERLEQPKLESAKLRGMSDCYKIKLRGSGHRLVYQVRDNELVVIKAAGK